MDKKDFKNYDFDKVLNHIEGMVTVKAKIAYLMQMKADYMQFIDGMCFEFGTPFNKQCEIEISKLMDLQKLEIQSTAKELPPFKISNKKGAKTDLTRVLNALYELKLIAKADDQMPSKKEFFNHITELLGLDLESYQLTLSQSKNQSLDTNLRVFESLKAITEKSIIKDK